MNNSQISHHPKNGRRPRAWATQKTVASGIPVQWLVSWGVASKAEGPLSTTCEHRRGVLISAMMIERPWIRRAIVWCLAYCWTAAGAVAISYVAGWQYDGDLGWWLVAAYSFPALALASPLVSLVGDPDLGATYSVIALAALTVAVVLSLRRSARLPNGS